MSKWEKLENSINKKLEKTFSDVGDVVKGATPEKMRQWRGEAAQKISSSASSVLSAPAKLGQQIDSIKQHSVEKAQAIKVDLSKSIDKNKSGKLGKLGFVAAFVAILQWAFIPLYKKLSLLFATMQPATLASTVILVTVGSIAGIGVYNSSNKIAEEAGLIERAPAAIEKPDPRPKYYKRNERELLVANVVVPSYIEGKTTLRKLQIDFTVISSNRYIREYFFDNAYLLDDVLNSKIEPVIPEFPLGDEGKMIIKEKIKAELNQLLKKMKIEGSIDSIYISSILAA